MKKDENNIKVIVVGKNGFIAKNFIEYFKKNNFNYVKTTSKKIDQKDEFLLRLEGVDNVPKKVINTYPCVLFLAGISSPDLCRSEYKKIYNINVDGSIRFIRRCIENNARVLFFSSDTVYGETNNYVDESSEINPIGEYAYMKSLVESEFKNNKRFKIARMSYVISSNDKFTKYLKGCSSKNIIAEIFHPFYRCPIWINDVIKASIEIFKNWENISENIFNFSGQKLFSRLDMAMIYKNNIDKKLKIKKILPDRNFYLARPEKINVKPMNLKQILGINPINIEIAYKKIFDC